MNKHANGDWNEMDFPLIGNVVLESKDDCVQYACRIVRFPCVQNYGKFELGISRKLLNKFQSSHI